MANVQIISSVQDFVKHLAKLLITQLWLFPFSRFMPLWMNITFSNRRTQQRRTIGHCWGPSCHWPLVCTMHLSLLDTDMGMLSYTSKLIHCFYSYYNYFQFQFILSYNSFFFSIFNWYHLPWHLSVQFINCL